VTSDRESLVDEAVLRDPAQRGVRLVALSLLDDTQKAGASLIAVLQELRDGEDAANRALHDFRVAVRRLRSWIRAFKPWLGDEISRKRRRRLSAMTGATRAIRDAAVELEWLRKVRPELSARQRVGQRWLIERLETQQRDACEDALSAAAELASMAPKLKRRLSVYRAPVLPGERTTCFGAVFAERLARESHELRDRLAGVKAFADVHEVHRARIAAKNLRYVAEPVSKVVEGGGDIIESLKKLQDLLGDLHDVHVFVEAVAEAVKDSAVAQAKRVSQVALGEGGADDSVRRARAHDPAPGLLRLSRLLHERGKRIYGDIEREWLNDAAAPLFEQVHDFAADVERCASVDREIERKYLLERVPEQVLDAPSVVIEQGYLPGEKVVERIRHVLSPGKADQWFRTVKAGTGIERVELDEEADGELCRSMWRLTKGRRLRKRRYSVRVADDLVWQVDEFLDRPLVLAEIELPAKATGVELPPWLRAVTDREVTDDQDYANVRLAQ
jgi:CHAD domain-containing protein/CYTH domain-containing protein